MAGKVKAAASKRSTAAGTHKDEVRTKVSARNSRARVKPTKRSAAADRSSRQPMILALQAEHRHMATAMKLLSEQLDAIEACDLVDTLVVFEIMEYMVSWPDRYHHPREDLIYGRVAELDSEMAEAVDTLQRDHDEMARRGREILADIQRWREGGMTGGGIVEAGRAYIEHQSEHMRVEEKLVFPRIETVLTLQDWRDLARDEHIRVVADPVFGPRVQREFRNMGRKVRRELRRRVERGAMVEWVGLEALMESLEVANMAYESSLQSASDHLKVAWRDGRQMFRESPLTAPFRCAANNARLSAQLLEDLAGISRDTWEDLGRINQERRDRIRLLD